MYFCINSYIFTNSVLLNDLKALEDNASDILKEAPCNVQRGLV